MVPIDMSNPRYSFYQGGECPLLIATADASLGARVATHADAPAFRACLMFFLFVSYFVFSASLQVMNAEEGDQGHYECVAENKVGTAYSNPAALYVRSKYLEESSAPRPSAMSSI